MRYAVTLMDAFFLTRPLLLVPVWGFSAFGWYRGLSAGKHVPVVALWTMQRSVPVFFWTAVFSLSVAAVYVFNQIADMNVDKKNKGLPLLARGKVSLKTAWTCGIACALFSILFPLFRHPLLSLFAAMAVLLGIVYSFRPVRLSGRCCLDFLANAAGYGIIAFGVGWQMSGAPFSATGFAVSALPYFLLMCAGSISSTLPDRDGDAKCGKKTTAVALGIRAAHVLATFFIGASVVASVALHDLVSGFCAACAVPFYLWYLVRPGQRGMEATYKAGGLLCMAAAAALQPVMALAAGAVAAMTRLYFKQRHHVAYPSLVAAPYEK